MDVMEFGIVYRVLGHAEKALQAVSSGLEDVARQGKLAESSNLAHAHSSGLMVDSSRMMRESVNLTTTSLGMQADALRNSTQELAAWGTAAYDAMTQIASTGVDTASRIESTDAKLRFSLRKNNMAFDETIAKLDEVSLKTVLTRDELSNMVSELAMQKINLFDDALNSMSVTLADGSQGVVTAAEAIQDAMAFSGKDIGYIMRSVREAASDQKLSSRMGIGDALNLSKAQVKEWNAELSKAATKQEAFNILMQKMATLVGGSTLAVKDTLAFTMQQIGDWKDKLYNEVFKGTLPIIRDLVQEIGTFVLELTGSGRLDAVRDTVTSIAQRSADMARHLFHATKNLVEFVAANPWVIKVAFGLAAGAMAAGKLVTALGTLGGLVFNLRVLFSALAPMIGAVVTSLGPILLIGAAIGFVATLVARMTVGGASFADTWSRVGAVLSGVFSLLKNMDMTTGFSFIDEEQAKKLEDMGLLGTVENIGRVLFRVAKTVEAMFDTFQANWPKIEEAGGRIFSNLEKAVQNLARAFGIALEPLGEQLEGAPDSAVDKWISFGVTVGDLMVGLVLKVAAVTEAVTGLIAKITEFAENNKLRDVYEFLNKAGGYIADTQLEALTGGDYVTDTYNSGDKGQEVAANNVKASGWRLDEMFAAAGTGTTSPGAGPGGTPWAAMAGGVGGTAARTDDGDVKFYNAQKKATYDGMVAAMRDHPPVIEMDGKSLVDQLSKYASRDEEDGR